MMNALRDALLELIDKVSSKSRHETIRERAAAERAINKLPADLEPMIVWLGIALHWRRKAKGGPWFERAVLEFRELYPGTDFVNTRDVLSTPWGTHVDGVRDAGDEGVQAPQWRETGEEE